MDNISAAAFGRKRRIISASAGRYFSTLARLQLIAIEINRQRRRLIELSTGVDKFVRNFIKQLSFKFKVLTGDHHA